MQRALCLSSPPQVVFNCLFFSLCCLPPSSSFPLSSSCLVLLLHCSSFKICCSCDGNIRKVFLSSPVVHSVQLVPLPLPLPLPCCCSCCSCYLSLTVAFLSGLFFSLSALFCTPSCAVLPRFVLACHSSSAPLLCLLFLSIAAIRSCRVLLHCFPAELLRCILFFFFLLSGAHVATAVIYSMKIWSPLRFCQKAKSTLPW